MSLSAISNLVTGSRPYYLYRFQKGSQQFLFNNTSVDLIRTVAGVVDGVWLASSLSHGRIPDSDQAFRSELMVDIPLSSPLADELVSSFDVEPVILTILKGDLNSTEIISVFKGRVLAVKPDESGVCQLTCMTEIASLQRRGLAAVIQRPCRHVHYGRGCGLSLLAWQSNSQIVSISANQTTLLTTNASSFADGYYNLGLLEWSGKLEMIISHTGNTLVLAAAIPGLASAVVDAVFGDPVEIKIAPGCPLSRPVCNDRFNNIANFGGFPFISDNVFDGRQVF